MSTTYVPLHYKQCQCFHKNFLLLLTLVSVHQEISENEYMALTLLTIKFMPTVQLTGAKSYDTKMVINTGKRTYDVSLAIEFQNTCPVWNANME